VFPATNRLAARQANFQPSINRCAQAALERKIKKDRSMVILVCGFLYYNVTIVAQLPTASVLYFLPVMHDEYH
jgi:hypothetical protein